MPGWFFWAQPSPQLITPANTNDPETTKFKGWYEERLSNEFVFHSAFHWKNSLYIVLEKEKPKKIVAFLKQLIQKPKKVNLFLLS